MQHNIEGEGVSKVLETNPKYNGIHTCPGCGTAARWICVQDAPVVIRVICEGECGTFESSYNELQTFPYFDKPTRKLAIQ